jgi:hypothetical protein
VNRIIVTRIIITSLCLTLCLVGITVPTASAATRLTTSARTALVSCLQQEYLMRDAYQTIFAKYPTLMAFGTVAKDEIAMISTLKKVFAKYKISVPSDSQVTAAQVIAGSATAISTADAVAINLEQSTATLMTQLVQTAGNQDVLNAIALIKTASLNSHTSAFTAEQTAVAIPAPAPAPVPAPEPTPVPAPEPTPVPAPEPTPVPAPVPTLPTERIAAFTPSQTSAALLTLLRDETIDAIELNGTYRLPYTIINIDRTRPVVIRPAAGAVVVMSGASVGTDPQFWLGLNGTAGNITMQGLIFDGFILGQQGIIQACDVHDITLNDMVVRNSRSDGTTAQPYHSWAIYLSSTSTLRPTNFTANRWTIDGSARGMSAVKVQGGANISLSGWSVSNAYYALYVTAKGDLLTDFVLDGWTISNTGAPAWGSSNVSVAMEYASGRYSNIRATTSGVLLNVGTPRMTDAGGNSI